MNMKELGSFVVYKFFFSKDDVFSHQTLSHESLWGRQILTDENLIRDTNTHYSTDNIYHVFATAGFLLANSTLL